MDVFCDLHLHSCLSPCGDDEMTPWNLVGMACVNGLSLIALTDHNTTRNVPEAIEAGKLSPDDMITADESALRGVTSDSSTQNIKPGETMSVKDLLHCMLVASANGIGWLKWLLALPVLIVSVLGGGMLILKQEHKRRRSWWMLASFAGLLLCTLVSLIARFPAP
jgi:hypothetical protein